MSNQYTWQVSSNCGLAAGNYLVKRREIRATISYPYTPSPVIVGAANGLSAASPNNGRQYIGTVSASETLATVNTYIYEVYSIAGQYLGWYPTTAANVRFNFKVLSALDTDLHLQNQNITTTASHAAIKSITAEDFTIQSGANVTLRAGEQTVLKPGFYAVDGSTFRAYIEPFFTCEQFPAMIAPQNNNYQETPDYVIKNYEVEDTPLPNKEITVESAYFSVYPNPALDYINIEYSLNRSESVEILLYDNSGKLVYRLKNKSVHETGAYLVKLNGIVLPSGIYHCVLQTENRKDTKQVIIH